jgi:hypothetical protein
MPAVPVAPQEPRRPSRDALLNRCGSAPPLEGKGPAVARTRINTTRSWDPRHVDPDDPLLTAPAEGWLRHPEPGEDAERVAVEGVMDYLDATAMSWPARSRDGRLVPPPDEHVLDHLARSHDLVDEDEALSRPAGPYTVECVVELPGCELCEANSARYYGHLASIHR